MEISGMFHVVSTLSEIARHAGVGIGTVSRVLNDSPHVSDAMRDRVMASAEAVGYRASEKRRPRRSVSQGLVGVLVAFFDAPSVQQRFSGIIPRVQSNDMNVVIYNVVSPTQARSVLADLPRAKNLDGLIIVSMPLTGEEEVALRKAAFPTALLDSSAVGLPSITIDDRDGGRIATQHLLDLGHRRIGFVGEPVDNPFGFVSSARREQGYLAALEGAGVAADPDLIRRGSHLRSAARQMTLDLMALPEPPTAIVASSDVQAVGVLEAAQSLGRRVPDDLSVVGYDDIDIAPFLGLTTVRQPLERSGDRAAEIVLQAMNAARRPTLHETLELELVVRSTTRPPR